MNIQSLSTSERILLAEKIWESVRLKHDQIVLSPEQVELLEERLSALESDGQPGSDWETVKARITNGS